MLAFAALFGLVTVEFVPTPLPRALKTLSEAMGRRLECVPALADEVLLARLSDADPERVLREVAFALDAKWEPRDDRLVLRRDPAVAARAEAEARRKAANDVAGSLARIAKALAAQPRVFSKNQGARYRKYREAFERAQRKANDSGEVEDFFRGIEDKEFDGKFTPGWRALARILAALGPRPFLALREGERTVWSDRPTAMQGSLAAAQGALTAFRAEYALVDPRKSAVRFRLVAKNDERRTVRFVALDARGGVVEEMEEALSGYSDGEGEEDEEETPPRAGEKPLELPEETRDYLSWVGQTKKAVRGTSFARWAPRLADPVADEPMRPYPGLAFLAIARAQGRNLVGTVWDWGDQRFGDEPLASRPSDLLRYLAGAWTLRDGWLVAKPLGDPMRVPRAEGRALIARALRQGGLDVDAAADWFARNPDPEGFASVTWLGLALQALVSGSDPNSALATFEAADALRSWSAFGPAVRKALRAGEAVPIAALPAGAIEELSRKVFWEDALETGDAAEITEIFPNGLRNGNVSLEIDEEPVFVAWSDAVGEPVYRMPSMAVRYGVQLGQFERRGQAAEFDRFRPGTTRTYTLTYTVAPGRSFAEGMNETFLDLAAAPLERLPDDFLRKAEASRKAFLERAPSRPPGGGEPLR